MIDLAALKTEIQNDPAALGYAGLQPGAQANLINAVGSATADVPRKQVRAQEILAVVRQGEYHAVHAAAGGDSKTRLFQTLLTANVENLDWSDTQVRNLIRSCFPAPDAPNTRSDIIALETISSTVATRAEELFGHGAVVDHTDISEALAS